MNSSVRRQLLVLQHVSWESPGLILDAIADLPVSTQTVLTDPAPRLPRIDELAGIVAMGGPMGALDDDAYPGLRAERALLADAVAAHIPVLGICLGAQLLARALGATVHPGAVHEVGWGPVRIHDPEDPIVGPLAQEAVVLHWHADVFEPPPGAITLASTDAWAAQAFRLDYAWGLQFHPEVDEPLIAQWLSKPTMIDQARQSLGPDAVSSLIEETRLHAPALRDTALTGLRTFAELVSQRNS
jgi:GMP synthase (glutamine-hydrolysing)